MTVTWLVYSTFPGQDKAFSAAQALLAERLIACANISAPILSLYRWQGNLQQEAEVAFLAKTSEKKVEAAIARLRELHPYEVPAILSWPAAKGFMPFCAWVEEETQ